MASFTTTATTVNPKLSVDDRGTAPPVRGGGADGDSGPDSPDYSTRLRRARLGLLVALTPVLMLFVSFTSALIVRQGLPTLDPQTNLLVRDWIPVNLPNLLLSFNTCVLLVSTVSMELARRQIKAEVAASRPAIPEVSSGKQAAMPWLTMTVAFGICFLTGQWMAWRELAARGFYISTSPSSSFVYLLTGTHGIHLMGGVLALLAAGGAKLLKRPLETKGILVDVTAWYWHFMAVLWVYILCLLEFAR